MNVDEQMHLLEDMVCSLAARYRPVDRDDACQEARLELWKALPHYDASRCDLRGFAFVVLTNHFRRTGARRMQKLQQRMAAEAEFSGDYYAPRASDEVWHRQMEQINQAVQKLPAEQRFVVLSAFGMTEEGERARIYMAKRIGVSKQQTAGVLRRALARLRNQIEKEAGA